MLFLYVAPQPHPLIPRVSAQADLRDRVAELQEKRDLCSVITAAMAAVGEWFLYHLAFRWSIKWPGGKRIRQLNLLCVASTDQGEHGTVLHNFQGKFEWRGYLCLI